MAKKKPTAPKSGRSAAKPARKSKSAPAKKTKPTRTAGKKAAAVKKVVAKKKAVAARPLKGAPARGGGKTPAKKVNAPKKVVAKKAAAVKKVAVKKAATKPVKKAAASPVKPARQAAPARPAKNVTSKAAEPKPAVVAAKEGPASASPAPKAAPKPAPPPVKKRPMKERVVMEFYLNSSPHALYELLSTPSGFSEWYCQDVDVRGDQYTFLWDGEQEETTLIGRKLGEVIRFRRNDDEDPEAFFEFRVRIDAMTNDVCLVVTDHAWPHEVEETRNLWTSQIETLGRVLGA